MTSFRRHWLGSANWSVSSDSRRPTSIFFKKPCSTSGKRTSGAARWRDDIYAVIQSMMVSGLQGMIAVERMCGLAGVSRSGYYRYWQASSPRREEAGLRDAIQRLALANPHYGYRRIAVLLGREAWHVNHKRVLRLIREDNLLCLRRAAFVPMTTNSRHGWRIVPNLARGLELADIDQLWVADITYVHLAEEFAYLAVVLDAFSRKVVGWALAIPLRAELAIEALDQAIAVRRPAPGSIIHHSDRGVQGGFNRSSQHRHHTVPQGADRGLRQVFSSRAFCAVLC
ncbi:IS3 family transposase [Mesorhizobium sp. M0400]|uniref:IS3 family transposase n=1 Tax=Mesorhizobium sp. M0400 TaxID=2956941 RepID=UPI00333C07FD